MATSDILNIWNNAIGNLGVKSSISALTEQSAEAAACALNYPTMIKRLLRETDWSCVRMTADLTDLTATFAAPTRWAYRYQYPTNCHRVWRMQNASALLWAWPNYIQGFELAIDLDPGNSNLPTRYIYSNWTNLAAVFTLYAFDSAHGYYEALFDDSLIDCASWALAAEIAGALTGNAQIMAQARAEADRLLQEARAANANESAPNNVNLPAAESLAVRGMTTYWAYPPNFAYLADNWDW